MIRDAQVVKFLTDVLPCKKVIRTLHLVYTLAFLFCTLHGTLHSRYVIILFIDRISGKN